jgi:hypothetical protein
MAVTLPTSADRDILLEISHSPHICIVPALAACFRFVGAEAAVDEDNAARTDEIPLYGLL